MARNVVYVESTGHGPDNPVFFLSVSGRSLGFGDRALLYAFLQTVAEQLEGGAAGSRFPLLQSIVDGQIPGEHCEAVHQEALQIQAELRPVDGDELPGIDGATWDWIHEDGDFISVRRTKIKDWLVTAAEEKPLLKGRRLHCMPHGHPLERHLGRLRHLPRRQDHPVRPHASSTTATQMSKRRHSWP